MYVYNFIKCKKTYDKLNLYLKKSVNKVLTKC